MKQSLVFILLPLIYSTQAFAQTDSWSQFMTGQRSTYSTKGVAKAIGLEVTFEYPAGWSGAVGRRPNTLYQVTSDQGKGLEICNLLIRQLPLPGDYTPTRAEIKELFEPATLPSFLPEGATLIDGASTTLDGQPGAWIHFSQDMDRAGMSIQMQWVTFPVYYKKRLIVFSCAVGSGASTSPEYLQKRYKAFFPLFQQMASSLIIHSKWKGAP